MLILKWGCHFIGVGLTLHHLRKTQTCINGSGYEELQPIDQNLQYDFNFQQANHLPNLVNVQPVRCEVTAIIS